MDDKILNQNHVYHHYKEFSNLVFSWMLILATEYV